MSQLFTLEPRAWCGWQQLGPSGIDAPWRASPIYIESVEPLKSGQGLLDVGAIILLRPFQARRARVRLRVVSRAQEALIAFWEAPGEPATMVAISALDRGWVDQHCAWLTETHPIETILPERDGTLTFSKSNAAATASALLNHAFGETPEAILVGAAAVRSDWPTNKTTPRQTGVVEVDWICRGIPAYLLMKGTIPQAQEDKWYIFRDEDRIIFQRSWTGIRIWEAAIKVSPTTVTVTTITVNRDRRQYAFGSPADEVARFDRCVTAVLWGRESWGYDPEVGTPRQVAGAWRRYKQNAR